MEFSSVKECLTEQDGYEMFCKKKDQCLFTVVR